jgi:hypothetical protein
LPPTKSLGQKTFLRLLVVKWGEMTVQSDKISYCRKGAMSVCTATSVDEQKKCRYYQRSSYSDRCMYLIFGKYCDCLDAQEDTQKQGAPEIL